MTEDAEYGSEIYLVVEAGAATADRLTAIFQAAGVASVLIRPPEGATLDARAAQPLVELVQSHGIAALIWDDASLARALRADGVHLDASDEILARYEEARDILGRRYIVGAHAGKSRHDAMMLGEKEADYVAFGVPEFVKEKDTARTRRDDLVGWWCEIFEVPCVALDVSGADEAARLAEMHADFIGLTVDHTRSPADAAAFVAGAAAAIGAAGSTDSGGAGE